MGLSRSGFDLGVAMSCLGLATAGITIPALRWQMPGVAQPMRYEPDDVLRRIRALGALPQLPQEARECADRLLELPSHHARVAAALVLLAAGGADEAHNLITPLSWHYGTPFAGPAIDDSPAKREAMYAHALVHRLEANHPGEFGSGFHNSAFWFSALGEHPCFRQARLAALHEASHLRDHKLICRWVDESLLAPSDPEGLQPGEVSGWSPVALNGLLAFATATPDDELRAFCQNLATAELHVLLQHCLDQCGVQLEPTQSAGTDAVVEPPRQRRPTQHRGEPQMRGALRSSVGLAEAEVRTELGLRAAGKLSTAHAAAFARSGLVAVRGCLPVPKAEPDFARDAAAAALAARALDVESVWAAEALGDAGAGGMGDGERGRIVVITFTPSSAAASATAGSPVEALVEVGGSKWALAPTDALVVCPSLLRQLQSADGDGRDGRRCWQASIFSTTPQSIGHVACWCDPLHGKRGETPTTVVEWSKGPPASGEVWPLQPRTPRLN